MTPHKDEEGELSQTSYSLPPPVYVFPIPTSTLVPLLSVECEF